MKIWESNISSERIWPLTKESDGITQAENTKISPGTIWFMMKQKYMGFILIYWIQARWHEAEVSIINGTSTGQESLQKVQDKIKFCAQHMFWETSLMDPLRQLLHKNITWQCLWHDIEKLFCKAPVFRLSDTNMPVIIQVCVSREDFRACLQDRSHVICKTISEWVMTWLRTTYYVICHKRLDGEDCNIVTTQSMQSNIM